MALPTCTKCGAVNSFEVEEVSPSGSKFKLMFVQCSRCGGVVGVQEYYNTGALIAKQNEAIKEIAQKLGVWVNLDTRL
jgi:hypothetical protein